MERSVRFAVVCVGVSLLVSCQSVGAWYKQSTGPSYYSVGRASGLLSGMRRSPYVRRADSEETVTDSGEVAGNNVMSEANRQISILKNMVSTDEALEKLEVNKIKRKYFLQREAREEARVKPLSLSAPDSCVRIYIVQERLYSGKYFYLFICALHNKLMRRHVKITAKSSCVKASNC